MINLAEAQQKSELHRFHEREKEAKVVMNVNSTPMIALTRETIQKE